MNYLEQYCQFYTGENRKAIYRIFYKFIDCLRTEQLDELQTLLTDDCIGDFSTVGHHEGKQDIANALRWPGPQMDIRRKTIWNFIMRSHGDTAQQYAYTQSVYAQEDENDVYPFVFGGHFCMTYKKINGVWKISQIKYDLTHESGNNLYVRGAWKLMDYAQYMGHQPMIHHVTDAPWVKIPVDDEPVSDIEAALEAGMIANYLEDTNAFDDMFQVYSKDISADLSARGNKNKSVAGNGDSSYYGPLSMIDFQRGKFHKEARLQHTTNMGDIIINGDEATICSFRSEFQRLYHKVYTKANIHSIVYTAYNDTKMRREDGQWKMLSSGYYPCVKFLPLDDDCLQYDELICGGQKLTELSRETIMKSYLE
jgi:hypothetical protein